MPEPTRQVHFNVHVNGVGNHEAAWRHPISAGDRVLDIRFYVELAQLAERGKLDAVFFGDRPVVSGNPARSPTPRFDPIALLSALSASTDRIGLAGTASTSYNEPYTVARNFASLDIISGGRAAWNIVTTSNPEAALNYGLDARAAHHLRYERAYEFVDVVLGLWAGWEKDAIISDADRGIYADIEKVHTLNYRGKYFKVRGPLNVPRTPQGRPVLIQAGSSDDGKAFAANYADVFFTAQRTLENAQAFYSDIKGRVAAAGRNPDDTRVLVGLSPIIGSTEEEANRIKDELDDLTDPAHGIAQIKIQSDVDLSSYPLDDPFPVELFSNVEGHQSRSALLVDLATREKLTLRQVLRKIATARGHQTLVGTPEQIAGQIEEWFVNRGADGFNYMPPYLLRGLEDFVDQVIPILQARGIFRHDYEGETLRSHYGLPDPIDPPVVSYPVPELTHAAG